MSTENAIAPPADWVTITEYIRRKHQADKEKDALATKVSFRTILSKIRSGAMKARQEDDRHFIDWEKYKDYPLRTYFQMPTRKK
jgi:hypothetical protein